MNKSAKLNSGLISSIVLTIVVVLILLESYAAITPTAQAAGDKMNSTARCEAAGCFYNATTDAESGITADCRNNISVSAIPCDSDLSDGIPLSSLFGGTSVVFVIIIAMLLVTITLGVMPKGK